MKANQQLSGNFGQNRYLFGNSDSTNININTTKAVDSTCVGQLIEAQQIYHQQCRAQGEELKDLDRNAKETKMEVLSSKEDLSQRRLEMSHKMSWMLNLGSKGDLIKKLLLFYVDFILVVLDRIQCDHSKTVATTAMTIRIPKHDHATVA